jgi:hypothetical protein
MNIIEKISIARDFSATLGARYKTDGKWSGEEFLDSLLREKFEKAVQGDGLLLIDLDGVFGYPSSFVSGSFGKLSVDKSAEVVLRHLQFKSDDSPIRLEQVIAEIKNPKKKEQNS